MRKINLSISGCMGRMGQQLIKSSKKDKNRTVKCIYNYALIISCRTNKRYWGQYSWLDLDA